MKAKTLIASLIFSIFLVIGCQTPSTQEVTKNLKGYWEIYQVKGPDGEIRKVYKVNPAVDYIEIDSNQNGIRIKLQPQFDGKYRTNKNAEHFTINKENDSVRFHYKTEMDEWTETLIKSDKDEFTVKNNRGMVYTYKRFEGLDEALKAHGHGSK